MKKKFYVKAITIREYITEWYRKIDCQPVVQRLPIQQHALEKAQGEQFDPYAPMAGGGIAGLSGGRRFGPPPESGPDPQGLASMDNYATKRTG